jgi:hypothetical protein
MFGFLSFLKTILIFMMFLVAVISTIGGLFDLSKKKREKRRERGVRHPLLGTLILLVFGIVLGWLAFIWAFHEKNSVFKPYLSEYARVFSQVGDPSCNSDDCVYTRNKILLLDKVEGNYEKLEFESGQSWFVSSYFVKNDNVSVLHEELPNEIRAAKPEEVETIIWLNWSLKTVHYYTGGSKGYQVNCTLMIYDKQKKLLIRLKDFAGEVPDSPLKTKGSFNGKPPVKDIITYLSALRRIGT